MTARLPRGAYFSGIPAAILLNTGKFRNSFGLLITGCSEPSRLVLQQSVA
jgi:hypothetical protein